MTDDFEALLSPTLSKVLDAFSEAVKADELIGDGVMLRLDTLLRTGKIPKQDEIDAALFPSEDDSGAEESNGS